MAQLKIRWEQLFVIVDLYIKLKINLFYTMNLEKKTILVLDRFQSAIYGKSA